MPVGFKVKAIGYFYQARAIPPHVLKMLIHKDGHLVVVPVSVRSSRCFARLPRGQPSWWARRRKKRAYRERRRWRRGGLELEKRIHRAQAGGGNVWQWQRLFLLRFGSNLNGINHLTALCVGTLGACTPQSSGETFACTPAMNTWLQITTQILLPTGVHLLRRNQKWQRLLVETP